MEFGSNSNGIYLKFANGILICAKRVTGTVSMTGAWGSLYDGKISSLGNWAHAFNAKPYVSIMPDNGTAMMVEGFTGEFLPSATGCGGVWVCRGTSSANQAYSISVIGIGTWK